ncbi:MAG TPA: hypothetical protein VIG88_07095 [Lysobacter sp.]
MSQAEAALCTSPRRRELWVGLQLFLDVEVRPHGNLPVWIDGSFTRRKDYPDDIDVVVDFSGCTATDVIQTALSLYVRNQSIKAAYQIDAYPRHPALPQDLSEFFQYAGPKVAAELHLDAKQRKGILRVTP